MSCSNCYNGCPEITSDQCVKYTGVDVPILGIKNGDSLSYVEQALITFLSSTLDGSGIKPDISLTDSYLCEVVKKYLPDCEDINAENLFIALIKAACDLQTQLTNAVDDLQSQIDDIDSTLTTLNATYTGVGVGTCLPSVTGNAGTHSILQAVITQLCTVTNTYVPLVDLDTLIQDYLDSIAPADKFYNKMVPWTVVEYYQDLNYYMPASGFDPTGAGFGKFEKIYLCNGQNGTPDKRGRVTVGAIQNVGGGVLDAQVDPATPGGFNPNYNRNTKVGANNITITVGQMPAHTHVAVSNVIDPGHFTSIKVYPSDQSDWRQGGGTGRPVTGIENIIVGTSAASLLATSTTLDKTNITVDTTNSIEGSTGAHANNQPAIGAYYIMYIP